MLRIHLRKFLYLLIPSLSFLIVQANAANDTGEKVKWGYTGNVGPAHWGQLAPDFILCAQGKEQSPINITKMVPAASNTLTIHYRKAPLIIVKDVINYLTMPNHQTIANHEHGVQLNFPQKGPQETITLDGKNYRLMQFHFHTPSENKLNGKTYNGEIHFVSQSADGTIAVMGVFIKTGAKNDTIQKIINYLPKTKGQVKAIQNKQINPINLLPQAKNYYRFNGSLTTPPCTEGLKWIIFAQPITASAKQIAILKVAADGNNARPIQSLHGRKIIYSQK